jgi:hypothetical protein
MQSRQKAEIRSQAIDRRMMIGDSIRLLVVALIGIVSALLIRRSTQADCERPAVDCRQCPLVTDCSLPRRQDNQEPGSSHV